MDIERAIEVFVRGFSATRSYTHPFMASRIGGAWVMRDEPARIRDSRAEEYVGHAVSPEALDQMARRTARGRYFICAIRAIDEKDIAIRGEFKALGYRLMATEPLFVHDLVHHPEVECGYPVERIEDWSQAQILAKAAGRRQILERHLCESPLTVRQYAAMDGVDPIGWVRSIRVDNAAYCSNLFVQERYRRKGIGRALIARMLADDRQFGLESNVLLASHTGAHLYRNLGYHQIGELLMFVRRKN